MSSPTGSDPSSHLSAVPETQESAEAPAENVVVEEPQEEERVSRKLFLGVLVGLLLVVIGFFVQSQRIQGFQAEIGGLEGEVRGLTSDLEAAHARVQSFEAQRAQIHRSVQLVLEDVLALEAVVASEPPSTAPLAPQDAPGAGSTVESELP